MVTLDAAFLPNLIGDARVLSVAGAAFGTNMLPGIPALDDFPQLDVVVGVRLEGDGGRLADPVVGVHPGLVQARVVQEEGDGVVFGRQQKDDGQPLVLFGVGLLVLDGVTTTGAHVVRVPDRQVVVVFGAQGVSEIVTRAMDQIPMI